MNRPSVWAASALALGILFGGSVASPAQYIAAALLLFAVCTWANVRSTGARDRALLAAVFMILGVVLGASRSGKGEEGDLARYFRKTSEWGALYTLEGTVREGWLYREGQYGQMIVDISGYDHPAGRWQIRGGVSVRCSEPTGPLLAGTRVKLRGRLDHTLSQVNFHASSIEDYLRARDVNLGMTVKARDIDILGVNWWSPMHWAERLRQAEADLLARHLPPDILPFILAVWLGEGAMLSPEEFDAFVVSGTAHVLSVSGVHVAIVYMTLSLFFAWGVRSRKRRAMLIIAGVFAYALLAGAHVATLRSALMFSLYLAAEFFDREPDAGTSLGLAALLFLSVEPFYVYDAGFLLSFLSVASMLLFGEAIRDRLPWRLGPVRDGIATALSAQILSFPMAAKFFHVLPLYGIFANLIVVPLLTAVIWLCVFTTLAAPIAPPVADLAGGGLIALVRATRWLVAFFADLPGSRQLISAPAWYALPFFWAAAFAAAAALRGHLRARRLWAATAALLAISAYLWTPQPDGPAVEMLDVGHGDAMFIRSPGGTTILIDGGDRDEYRDLGRRVVVPTLLGRGVRRLDYIVCTHPDRDHIGGLQEVVRRLEVGELIMGGGPSGAPLEAALLRECLARGVPVRYVRRGDTIPVAGAHIDVLHPGDDFAQADKPNNRSIVLRVGWVGFDMLCTGDIEAPAEAQLLKFGIDEVQVLKVPHHGSDTSSTAAFLNAVRPRVALCSTEALVNRRPVHPDVATRYAERAIPLRRTDYEGGLRIVFHGDGSWHIEGARPARGYNLDPAAAASAPN
jgi:competence protein ComEC